MRPTAEHAFFAAIVLWLVALVWWRPEPVITFADAPSSRTNEHGYSLFYELVATQTLGARRVLSPASDYPEDVGVVVLLSPREPVPTKAIDELLSWVEAGHTLIVAHPLSISSGDIDDVAGSGLLGCSLSPMIEAELSTLTYTPSVEASARSVPAFEHWVPRVLSVESCEAVALLVNETNDPVAVLQEHGAGRVIELADSQLVSNSSIGWKRSHLWVAALMDEAGRDKVWAFDESYHGIKPEPQLVRLLGAGRLRTVFLHVVLLVLIGYWWKTRRLGAPLRRESRVSAREVATLIDDVGAFYLRAGKSLWALDRSVEHLRRSLRERGVSEEARTEAEAVLEKARAALQRGTNNLSEHLPLLVSLAAAQHRLGLADAARKKRKAK